MARTWTPEQKAKQAALIRAWKPWKQSTGPRTSEGKAASSKNVSIGRERKQKEIAQAKADLLAAQIKLISLTFRKGGMPKGIIEEMWLHFSLATKSPIGRVG